MAQSADASPVLDGSSRRITHDGKDYASFVDLLKAYPDAASLPYFQFFLDFVNIFDSLFSGILTWPEEFAESQVSQIFENLYGICIAPNLLSISYSVSLLFLREYYNELLDQILNFHKIGFRSTHPDIPSVSNEILTENGKDNVSNVLSENSASIPSKCSNIVEKPRPSGQEDPPTDVKKVKPAKRREKNKRSRGVESDSEIPNSKVSADPNSVNYIESNDVEVNNVIFTDNTENVNKDSTASQISSDTPTYSDIIKKAPVEGAASTEHADKRYNITFYVEFPGNWRDFLEKLKDTTKIIPEAKLTGTFLKITVHDSETFRVVQKYLHDTKTNFQTLDPREERPKKFLFRGIPPRTSENEISEFVTSHGFHVVRVTNMKNRKTKAPMPLYLVACRPTPNLEKIYDINTFNFLKISVEQFNDNDVKQCYNCQGYGHSSFTCYLKPKCVRCAQPHKTPDCPLPKDARKATCANCFGPHPASYRGCPKNPKNKGKKNLKAVPLNATKNSDPKQPTAQNPPQFVVPTSNRFGLFFDNEKESTDCDSDDYTDVMEVDTATASAVQPSTSKNTNNGQIINTSSLCSPVNTSTRRKKKKNNKKSNKKSKSSDNPSDTAVLDSTNTLQKTPPTAQPTNKPVKNANFNKNQKNSSTDSSKSNNSFLADLLEILNILKSFLADLNLKNIISMFRNFVNIFRSDKPIDAIYALLEMFAHGQDSSPHHGQSA